MTESDRWWVFDKPLRRDPLFAAAIALGTASIVWGLVATSTSPIAYVLAYPEAIVFVGVGGGSVREFRRARKGASP